MKLVLVSDTHCTEPELPSGDILIHAGDFTISGSRSETEKAVRWFGREAKKFHWAVAIAGNHDWFLYHAGPKVSREFIDKYAGEHIVYLQDELANVMGLKIYGSPAQPEFCNWAWNYARGAEIKAVWDKIPANVDMLITHGPPMGILDWVGKERVGCEELRIAVERIKPRAHVFGHLHSAGGQHRRIGTTDFYNAAVVDESYKLAHASQVIEL